MQGKANYDACVFKFYPGLLQKPPTKPRKNDPMTVFRYETELTGGRWCVPTAKSMEGAANMGIQEFKKEFDKYFGGASLASYLADIMAAKEVLLWSLLAAFLIGFVYLIVLRILGGPIIYISIVAIIGGLAYGGYMLFETSNRMAATE